MECSQDINTANAERAKNEHPGMGFGEITVTINVINRTQNRIQFTTRGEDDQDHPFTCALSEVWLECPSTAQRAGDHGQLKITAVGLAAKSDRDGATPIKNVVSVEFKWPDRGAAGDLLAPLEIWPTNIIVEGYANGDPAARTSVSLLDHKLCGPKQTLHLDPANKITLSLTEAGFARFGILLEDSLPELAWAVEAAGKPAMIPKSVGLLSLQPPGNPRAEQIIERWRERERQGTLPDATVDAVRALLKLAA